MPAEGVRQANTPLIVRIGGVLIVVALPILLLGTALRIEMNSVGLYNRGFHTYGVSATTGISEAQLREAAVKLVRYFNHFEPTPQMNVVDVTGQEFELYHDYEIIHLDDVRDLFDLNSMAQAFSLLLVVALATAGWTSGRRHEVCAALKHGSLVAIVLLAATALAFLIDFNWAFVAFHLVAFDNPFWQLNPHTDYLVMLFPLGFWQEMALFAGAATGLMAGGIYALAHVSSRGPTGGTRDV